MPDPRPLETMYASEVRSLEHTASQRVVSLDALKFLAAAAIVALHMGSKATAEQPSILAGQLITAAFRWAVPVFFVVAGYLHARKMPAIDSLAGIWKRTRRLYGVYAVWTAVYVAAGFITERSLPTSLLGLLLQGGGNVGYHLWFLPVLAAASAAAAILGSKWVRTLVAALCVSLVIARLQGYVIPYDEVLGGAPLSHWFLLYLIGMLLPQTTCSEESSDGLRRASLIAAAAVGSCLLAAYAYVTRSSPQAEQAEWLFIIGSLLAVALVVGSILIAHGWSHRMMPVYRLSFGIYLIHYMMRALFGRVFPLGNGNVLGWAGIGFVIVFSMSLGAAALLYSNRSTRWLVS